MTKRDRLGRGLNALLGEYLTEQAPPDAARGQEVRKLPVARIVPNPFQPRREFAEEELAELANSIRENGLLQPVVVRPGRGEDRAWELVAGERRWRACIRLGWTEMPAIVRDVDDRTLLVLALVENIQRAQLSPLEEAEAFRRLSEEFSLTHQQIADVVGRDRSTVANTMRLLQLPASVRQLVASGRLTAGHARALLGLGSDRSIAELAREAAEKGWSVREVESRVRKAVGRRRARPPRAAASRDPAEQELEEELRRVMGTPVRIKRGRGLTGTIEIPFYSAEDFERVYELIAGRAPAEVLD